MQRFFQGGECSPSICLNLLREQSLSRLSFEQFFVRPKQLLVLQAATVLVQIPGARTTVIVLHCSRE